MARGIQVGTTAYDVESKSFDDIFKYQVIPLIQLKIKNTEGFSFQKKLRKDQIPGGIGACQPDGGILFYGEKPVLVFEAKKQGFFGNAIDRWFKNLFICRLINDQISYVTFATGEGCYPAGPIYKTLHVAHQSYNEFHYQNNSCFFIDDSHDVTSVLQIVENCLNQVLNNER